MLKKLRLTNVGPAPEMTLEFGSRLNLLTGDNGLGKSFLLDAAWWALTRRWPREINAHLTSGYAARPTDPRKPASIGFAVRSKTKSVDYESTYVPREESWRGKVGRPLNPGLVLYAHADGSFSVWDPARNFWKRTGNIDVQERLPGYVFSPQEVWDGLKVEIDGRATTVCNGLIRDWASWIQEGKINAKNMCAVLQRLSPSKERRDRLEPGPLVRISIDDARDIPSLRTSYAEAVPIVHASAGVRRIVALAYMLLWTWNEHRLAARQLGEDTTRQVVLLIDEVESHLHPRWQRSILNSLLKLTEVLHKEAEIQVLAATHSPLVLASAEPLFDDASDAWFDLDLTAQGQVELTKRPFVRRGDVSHWLTSEAFDLAEPRSLEAEEAIAEALAMLRNPQPTSRELRQTDKKLRATLSDVDRFWVRWSEFVESRGATQ